MTSSTFSGPSATDVDLRQHELAALQAEFPVFRIWQEITGDRVRFVARSRRRGLNPHTVVTADLSELRDALTPTAPGHSSLTVSSAGAPAPDPQRPDAAPPRQP